MKSITLMKADAEQHKARLQFLAKELETRALSEDEEKEVDGLKKDLNTLNGKIERVEYLNQIAAEKPKDKEERSFQKRMKDFSLSKVIAKAGGKSVDTGFEDETTEELKRNDPYAVGDYVVPWEVIDPKLETRTIDTSGTESTINDQLQPSLIPALRNALALSQLGAMTITGARSKVVLPRVSATGTASWLPETGAVSESDMTFDSVSASPEKLMSLTSWSALAALESSISVEQTARQDLIMDIAHEIDRASLYGKGTSNEPSGITKLNSFTARTGDDSDGGANLTYQQVLDLAETADVANIGMGRRAFLCNPQTKYKLMNALQQSKFTDSSGYIWPMGSAGIAGMPTVVSNVVESQRQNAGNKVTGSDLFYGNWSDFTIVTWGSGVSLLLNEYGAGYAAGNVQLRALVFTNVLIRYNKAVAWYRGIKN